MVKVDGLKRLTIAVAAQLEFRKHCRVVKWLVLARIGKLIRQRKSNGVLVISLIAMVVLVPHMPLGNHALRIGINMTPFMVLQVLPTPTGGTPINTQLTTRWTGNFQTDLTNFVNAANKAGDKQLATQFRAYA